MDLNWVGHPRAIGTAVLRGANSIALIDPGPSSCIHTLREELRALGIAVTDLEAILLTHIHLDHAGATGTLVHENPRLQVYVHQNGAPHMNDPTKLLHSASRLYGDTMQRLFGEFLPVPTQNLQVLQGSEVLVIGGRKLQVVYTPGHASHHVTYFDPQEGTAFVGDTAGISILGHPFVLPATPPPDISLELWDASLDRIQALKPRRLCLTHFSFSDHPERHLEHYRERLHYWSARVAAIKASGLDEAACMQKFTDEVHADAAKYISDEELERLAFTASLNLSWLGLVRYHRKKAEAAAATSPR